MREWAHNVAVERNLSTWHFPGGVVELLAAMIAEAYLRGAVDALRQQIRETTDEVEAITERGRW